MRLSPAFYDTTLDLPGFFRSRKKGKQTLRQGIFSRHSLLYWWLFLAASTRYRRSIGSAIRLAITGYHFEMLTAAFTRKLVKVVAECHGRAGSRRMFKIGASD